MSYTLTNNAPGTVRKFGCPGGGSSLLDNHPASGYTQSVWGVAACTNYTAGRVVVKTGQSCPRQLERQEALGETITEGVVVSF